MMLVWTNHARNLLESMRGLNMFFASDMEVVCKDGSVKTHSLLLAGASPLLRRALKSLNVELSAGNDVVIVMSWCEKSVVQKALDKLINAEDFKNETPEMLNVLKELGVNEDDGSNCAKEEVSEQLVTFKVEIDTDENITSVDGIFKEVEVNNKRRRPSEGDYWEGNEPDLVDYEPPTPKKKRGRPPKQKNICIENNNDTKAALTESVIETESILSEIEIDNINDMGVLKEDDSECQDLLKNEQNFDNQELFPEHTDNDLEDQVRNMIIRNEEGSFPCQFDNCDYIAGKTSKSRIRQHIMLHLQYRPFRCPHPTCDKTFVERAPAVQHYQIHTGAYNYKCPECGKLLRSLSGVKQHQLTSHSAGPALFQCQLCSYKTNLRGSWKRHELTHKEKDERPSFSCAECGATYLEIRAYHNHVENSCPGPGASPHGFKASMTPEMREAKEAAIKLINAVNITEDGKEVKNFICTHCSYSHKERDHVIRHCYAHTGVRPFHCKEAGCTRQFLEPRSLKDHVASVHEGVKAYQCDQCEASYSAKASLDSHLKRHLIPADHFKCEVPECGYATNNPSTLARHKERVHDPDSKKHLCTVCGKPFYDKRQLAKHELNNHTEPTIPCNYCDKFYHSETSRDKHEMTVHSEETPFQCDECPNAYRHPSSLQKHILAIHRGEEARKFRCEECGKGFITNGKLQSHRRVHTGERNYQCPHCEMRFGDQSAMRRHKYTHEGGKRYECNVCGKTYTQHYDVVRHKANVHGIVTTRVKDHVNKGKKMKRMPKRPRFSNLVTHEAL